MHYNHFRFAWYAYLEVLDVDYSTGFQCNHCGPHPELVIMDATALSFRKKYDFWNSFPITQIHSKGSVVQKGKYVLHAYMYMVYHNNLSSFSDRVLIPDQAVRYALMKYVKKGLTDEEMDILLTKCPLAIKEVLSHIDTDLQVHQCPSLWTDFIHSIGSSSPVCALIHPEKQAISLIERLCNEDITKDPQV